jgi:glycosyltransferase involved in cell wall biosynthesis
MFAGTLRQVWKSLAMADYDLIHAHYVYPDGVSAALLGRFFRKPVVVSALGTDINLFPQFRSIRPIVQHALKRADAVVAVATPLKDIMVRLGCPAEKIDVIGNCVDPLKFRPHPRAQTRRILGLPIDCPIILSVGGLSELKGFHILISAMARLRATHPSASLIIVGKGQYKSELESQIRSLRLESAVKLVGARPHEQLSTWYSAADVFCLASSREGCPNVVLEAMACGRPVIATPVGSNPELVVAETGALVDRTPEAFANAIAEALRRKWNHDAIVTHARSHGPEKVTRRLLNVYSKAIVRHKAISAG